MAPNWFKQTSFYQTHKYRLGRCNNFLSVLSALCLIFFLTADQSHLATQRLAMSSEIKFTALVTGLNSGIYKVDDKVIRAMAQVPRHHFIQQPYNDYAYLNVALPVEGHDYLIPEPFITAMNVHLMDIKPHDKVLEIGFGSSYDAAVMSKLAGKVYSVRHTDMDHATPYLNNAEEQGFDNVLSRRSSGADGWPEAGPFDAILVRQSMAEPPVALLKQLKPGGRLVIPVGMPNENQRIMVYTRGYGGHIDEHATLHVKIAPLLKGREI